MGYIWAVIAQQPYIGANLSLFVFDYEEYIGEQISLGLDEIQHRLSVGAMQEKILIHASGKKEKGNQGMGYVWENMVYFNTPNNLLDDAICICVLYSDGL